MKRKKTNEYVVILVLDFLLAVLFLMHQWPALIYAILGLTFFAVVIPPLRRLIAMGFDLLSGFIGKLVSIAMLSILYYGFLTPIAWIKKMAGKPALPFKRNVIGVTYFTAVSKKYEKADFEKLW